MTSFAAVIAIDALVAPNRISLLELEREAFSAEDRIRDAVLNDPQVVQQARMLRRFGCPQVHGFLYGRPETAAVHAKEALLISAEVAPLAKWHSAA